MIRLEKKKITKKNEDDDEKLLASGETYGVKGEAVEINEIGSGLRTMLDDLRRYINYVNSQTYIDGTTGVGNKAAYQKMIRIINEEIKNGVAEFAVGFFDINDLKPVNVKYGFEQGDEFLFATANILKNVFQQKNVYRVASDEFIVIVERIDEKGMKELFQKMDDEIMKYNLDRPEPPRLAVAKGLSVYRSGEESYRTVFIEAEADMRRDKEKFHRNQRQAP